jgi:hypothetical protein
MALPLLAPRSKAIMLRTFAIVNLLKWDFCEKTGEQRETICDEGHKAANPPIITHIL